MLHLSMLFFFTLLWQELLGVGQTQFQVLGVEDDWKEEELM